MGVPILASLDVRQVGESTDGVATYCSTDAGPVDTIVVPAVRLDSLSFDPISLIKIDVEGHEEAVIKGAAATITKEVEKQTPSRRPSALVKTTLWLKSKMGNQPLAGQVKRYGVPRRVLAIS